MQPISPMSNASVQHTQHADAMASEAQVNTVAITALKVLGAILLAASIGCLIASLVVPAIGLLVAAAAALLWGFSCQETAAPSSEAHIPDPTIPRTNNLSNLDDRSSSSIPQSQTTPPLSNLDTSSLADIAEEPLGNPPLDNPSSPLTLQSQTAPPRSNPDTSSLADIAEEPLGNAPLDNPSSPLTLQSQTSHTALNLTPIKEWLKYFWKKSLGDILLNINGMGCIFRCVEFDIIIQTQMDWALKKESGIFLSNRSVLNLDEQIPILQCLAALVAHSIHRTQGRLSQATGYFTNSIAQISDLVLALKKFAETGDLDACINQTMPDPATSQSTTLREILQGAITSPPNDPDFFSSYPNRQTWETLPLDQLPKAPLHGGIQQTVALMTRTPITWMSLVGHYIAGNEIKDMLPIIEFILQTESQLQFTPHPC